MSLILGPGSVLSHSPFDADIADSKRHDVTLCAAQFLFEPVELDQALILGDLFKLLDANEDLLRVFRRDYATELCAEARKGPLPPNHGDDRVEISGIEYLELYREWRHDTRDSTYWGVHDLHLHGVGIPVAMDVPDYGVKAGERIQWSVSLTPLRELLHLPLRVREHFEVSEDDIDACDYAKSLAQVRSTEVSLGQLIHGTLYELSFHGTPQEQAQVYETLMERKNQLDAGDLEMIPHDEVFADFDQAGFAALFATLGDTPKAEIRSVLRAIADDAAVGPQMERVFNGKVVVKSDYHDLPGRKFRRALRMARGAGER